MPAPVKQALHESAPHQFLQLNLENLVAKPTWREELRTMIEEEQLDPWNIDIILVADKFMERMKKLRTLDLGVPANLILAAAILLHLKSEALKFEEEQVAEEQTYLDDERPAIEVPELTLRTRIPPKRHVTLAELMGALDEALQYQKNREERLTLLSAPEPMEFILPEYNIEERMAEILKKATEMADSEGLLTFSSLVREPTAIEIIHTLMPILHLAQDGKLDIFQDKLFGEIFVQLKLTVN